MAKVIKQVKPLVLENKETGRTLTIEYNRAIILKMDRLGVISSDFMASADKSPLTFACTLFYWGLQMHHPEITEEEAQEILLDEIGLQDNLFARLSELFTTPYTSIMDARKNSLWTVK